MADNKYETENSIIEHVAHDFKGIIKKINSLNSMLRDELHGSKSILKVEQLLNYISILCEQGEQITNDLMESGELEMQQSKIIFADCYLNELIHQQGKIYKLQADKKEIKLFIEIPTQNVWCKISSSKIIRVLDNLFANALKFTHRQGEIKITLANTNTKSVISISDTGIGIPPELQKNLFQKYTPTSRYGTEKEKPTGLGLYITKRIIDLH